MNNLQNNNNKNKAEIRKRIAFLIFAKGLWNRVRGKHTYEKMKGNDCRELFPERQICQQQEKKNGWYKNWI